MNRWSLGVNDGGVESVVYYDADTDRMLAFDMQSAATNQVIADEAKKWRDAEAAGKLNPEGKMRLAAKIPITLWQSLRWQWMKKRKSGYDKTWQTFELWALRHPAVQEYLCTNKPLPTVYERDRHVSHGTMALPHLKPDPLLAELKAKPGKPEKATVLLDDYKLSRSPDAANETATKVAQMTAAHEVYKSLAAKDKT